MKSGYFMRYVVDPAASFMASITGWKPVMSRESCVLLVTCAGQETSWSQRRQVDGTARGYWQFEKDGAVAELFQKTPDDLRVVCVGLDIPYDPATVYDALAWNDILACSMARLLLWQDPAPLPALGDEAGAWNYYQRNWKPGTPRRESWAARYAQAQVMVAAL